MSEPRLAEPGAPGRAPLASMLEKSMAFMAELVASPDLAALLRLVVDVTPTLVNGAGCSVYLQPRLVPQFDGFLLNEAWQPFPDNELAGRPYVVLAATSRPEMRDHVGKAYYAADEGLLGWAFAKNRPLRVRDYSDAAELAAIDPLLRWSDKYNGSNRFYGPADRKPILIVPIKGDKEGPVGVLRIPASLDKLPFNEADERIAQTVAHIIGDTILRDATIRRQQATMMQLVTMTSQPDVDRTLEAIVGGLAGMLRFKHCRLHLLDWQRRLLTLKVEGTRAIDPARLKPHDTQRSGQGLIGWIAKTNKYLLIADAREFVERTRLEDNRLDNISDGPQINDEDRSLQVGRVEDMRAAREPIPFLGVPVSLPNGLVVGVLSANYLNEKGAERRGPFTQDDLKLAQDFARAAGVALDSQLQGEWNDLLIKFGSERDLDRLFADTVQKVAKLLHASSCHIFELATPSRLRLCRTSTTGSDAGKVEYPLGEGKTGFCGLSKSTLVANYYGTGRVDQLTMEQDLENLRKKESYKNDILDYLTNERHANVGLVQLRKGSLLPRPLRDAFLYLASEHIIAGENGLYSVRLQEYLNLKSPPAWSFAAVPIVTADGDLLGVLNVGRAMQRLPFSPDDIDKLEWVAARLGPVWQTKNELERRREDFLNMTHGLGLPLSGLIAETENLVMETAEGDELHDLAKHALNLALRLHQQTRTTIGAVTGDLPVRSFQPVNLKLVLDAIVELFHSEARSKGCDIRPPFVVGGAFPTLEMCEDDLRLALGNILQNAVKYSYKAPPGRHISILVSSPRPGWHAIAIENYGVGIPREEIENGSIFVAGRRGSTAGDRQRTGAGLGLPYARKVIEKLHGGQLAVRSVPQPGGAHLTTVTATLPGKQSLR